MTEVNSQNQDKGPLFKEKQNTDSKVQTIDNEQLEQVAGGTTISRKLMPNLPTIRIKTSSASNSED